MMKARFLRLTTVAMLMLTMLITSAASTFAASSAIRKTEYEGKGKVEVDFAKNVKYKNAKVTVKDTSGKTYTATIISKDKDDLEFRIKNYKAGKTYNYTIKGVKVKGSSKYKNLSGTVKIPSAKKSSSISRDKAIALAANHAKNKLNASDFRDKDAEKDTYKGTASWEVDFEAKINGKWYEFEYDINRSTGSVMRYSYEID